MTAYERRKLKSPPAEDAPTCECGCGNRVKWLVIKNCWARFLSGHNAKALKNGVCVAEVNWNDPRWTYVLGAHLGDGCDHRMLDIAVGKDEPGWADALVILLRELGLRPHVSKTLRVQASCVPVMREFLKWKPGGRRGLWKFPFLPKDVPELLAGLVDSDGSIAASSGGVTIYQRNNGNLEMLEALLRASGETRLHLGRDVRKKPAVIDGRTLPLGTSVRLGIRGSLRDEVFLRLRNPERIAAWTAYRATHSTKIGRPSNGV